MSKLIEGNKHYGVYINTKSKGRVECNHNDLMSIIGFGRQTFNIEWSKRNANSVYIYRDGFNIDSVALAVGIEDIQQIENATHYDRSQRTVTVTVGQVGLLQNIYGVWAAVKLLAVKNEYSNSTHERLVFDYEITESYSFNANNKKHTPQEPTTSFENEKEVVDPNTGDCLPHSETYLNYKLYKTLN